MSGKNMIPVSPSLDESFNAGVNESAKPPVTARVLLLSLQAVINAMIIGVIAKALVLFIDLITNLAFYQRLSFEPATPAANSLGWLVIIVPVAGSIIIGLMARFGSSAIRGHGIPEAMEKIIAGDSKIPVKLTFLKPLSAAISIGTGGPFGAEGPIIATGGAFGSVSGQIMRISASERKIMLAAGACAGMSAIFGSPLAAVLLAIELLLFEFSPRSVIPVALSCVAGAAMHLLLFESGPVFSMPAIPTASGTALTVYVLLGIVIGVLAAGVSRSVYALEDLFEKLPVHWMWWPAIGAVVVGITGYFAPLTLGVGYTNITGLLTGSLPLTALFVLCFLKYLSWVVALSSGTSGGTLAPLFTIGGAAGALIGTAVLSVFPASGINIATAAMIGMAAMFAGASRALLTSIVFLLETTGQPHALLPLIGACTAAYFVSFFLMKGSIMTEKIQRRGIKTPDSYHPDVLQNITIAAIMHKVPVVVNGTQQLQHDEVISKCMAGIATDDQGNFKGYVTAQPETTINDEQQRKAAVSSKLPVVNPQQSVASAAALMGQYHMERIAVTALGKLVGIVTGNDILSTYSEHLQKEDDYHVAISLKRRAKKMIIKSRAVVNTKAANDKT